MSLSKREPVEINHEPGKLTYNKGMSTRAGIAGLATGLLTALVAYGLFGLQPGVPWQTDSVIRCAWAIAMAALASGGGWWGGRWSGSVQPARGAALGALAGGLAGSLAFGLWGAALAGLGAAAQAVELSPAATIQAFIAHTLGVYLALTSIYLFYLNLGRWFNRWNASPKP